MAMHEANAALHDQCRNAAASRGWGMTLYRTNTDGQHSGYTRYTVYVGDRRPFGSRSCRVRGWEDAPHQKHWRPSIIGETRALGRLFAWLTETED